MFWFDSPEVSFGLFLLGVGQFVEHPKLESHHLHLLVVVWMVGLEVVHQCHSQLLLLYHIATKIIFMYVYRDFICLMLY